MDSSDRMTARGERRVIYGCGRRGAGHPSFRIPLNVVTGGMVSEMLNSDDERETLQYFGLITLVVINV